VGVAPETPFVSTIGLPLNPCIQLMFAPPWKGLLQSGGQAWTDAEKAKIADLNWRIVAEKPLV
jgi:hypothetical protein